MSAIQLQIFKFEDQQDHFENLTTMDIDGEVWFVASEVCKTLDIGNTSQAVKGLDEDEKQTIIINDSLSKNPNKIIISESGLYSLIFKSNKPSAKKFRRWVTKEVIPAIRKTGTYGINRLETPNFVVRFNENWDRTEKGYFSVISELFIRLYGKFEQVGYQIPNKALNEKEIRPDVSVGQRFAKYLRENHPEYENFYSYYSHIFSNGIEVEARQYKNEVLPTFIRFIDTVWMPEVAEKYFKERDPLALDYLPKLLGQPKEQSKFNKSLKQGLNYNPKN